jgi:nucleoside-diphosphate-sugar epimerase
MLAADHGVGRQMAILITGAAGNIGRRLMAGLPETVGLDRIAGSDIHADLGTVNFRRDPLRAALAAAEAVIHLATNSDPKAPASLHWQAIGDTARLLAACAAAKVPRVVLPSSDWAEPGPGMRPNAYGHSKRVIEAMAAMYMQDTGLTAIALRIGWVPGSAGELQRAPDWLAARYWDDARLVAEFRNALGL